MNSNLFGIIYTGDNSMRLKDLAYSRSIAAAPFGGRYRSIDFILSNLVNSGVSNVGVIAQKNYHSLMDHLGSGKEWDLSRKRDGLFMLPPYVTKDNVGLYRGTVEALKSVSGYIRRSTQRFVLVTGSYTIFNMPFTGMLERHVETGADITILYNRPGAFDQEDQYDDLRLALDESGRVTDMEFNPYRPFSPNQSCNAFLMEKTLLEYLVEEASSRGLYHFHEDVLLHNLHKLKIFGYPYEGYVARLNSPKSYFSSNMDLLRASVRKDLFHERHPIYTKVKDEVPARYGPHASAANSIVADGCIIDGTIEDCVLFRGVYVASGAKLSNCIVMQASQILENAEIRYAVLDKAVTVKRGRRLSGHEAFPLILRKGSIV